MTSQKHTPPFTRNTALAMVQKVMDAWNAHDPVRLSQNCAKDVQWRLGLSCLVGRNALCAFLAKKWQDQLAYRRIHELWAYTDNRISVRFQSEWRDAHTGTWFRTQGNEQWAFDNNGLLAECEVSADHVPILEMQRQFN